MFKASKNKISYTPKPENGTAYTEKMNRIYTKYAKAYDAFMVFFPLWKKWLKYVLPHIEGVKLLEVSFGPAWLMRKYPENMDLHGLDYNETMVEQARKKLKKHDIRAEIVKSNVENMPYADETFDTVVNTMAFSGYPDGEKALREMLRVLKPDGVIIILDYDYPANRNLFGVALVRFIELCGDIIKDIGGLIEECGAQYQRKVVGGFGSIQLFLIRKKIG